MGLQAAGRRKLWGARELDVGEMGLFGWCLRKSKTAGVLLWTLLVAALISNAALTFCVPKYARDSFNLTTSVESGLLVDGSSAALTEEGLALGAAGGREEEGTGCAGVGCGGDGIVRVVPQEE